MHIIFPKYHILYDLAGCALPKILEPIFIKMMLKIVHMILVFAYLDC